MRSSGNTSLIIYHQYITNDFFQGGTHMATLKIKESAILNNVREIRARTDSRIIAVIKENGYGLGLKTFYEILQKSGIDFYGVSSAKEAMELRALGCKEDILLLTPELSIKQCSDLLIQDVIFMLGSSEQADILKEASARTKIIPRIHLAIDTGLGRYGFHWNALEEIKLCTYGMNIEGCYTHFATASSRYARNIQKQVQRFEHAKDALSSMGIHYGITHVSASKAFLKYGDLGCDAVRIGSLLLGCSLNTSDSGFERAVWMEAAVYMKSFRKKGEEIGYDGRRKLRRDTVVGVVTSGYSDGIFIGGRDGEESVIFQLLRNCRRFVFRRNNGKYVEINDQKVPVLGKIGVGHLLLDLTDGDYLIGDTVKIYVNPLFVPQDVKRCLTGTKTPVSTDTPAVQNQNIRWILTASRAGICLNKSV